MFRFIRRNMRNSGKDISTMSRRPLNTITMINPSLPRLSIHVKVFQVIIEINIAGTEVPTKKGSVGSEDGG